LSNSRCPFFHERYTGFHELSLKIFESFQSQIHKTGGNTIHSIEANKVNNTTEVSRNRSEEESLRQLWNDVTERIDEEDAVTTIEVPIEGDAVKSEVHNDNNILEPAEVDRDYSQSEIGGIEGTCEEVEVTIIERRDLPLRAAISTEAIICHDGPLTVVVRSSPN
jgi:hypothetical protein